MSSFRWTDTSLFTNMRTAPVRLEAEMRAISASNGKDLVSYAKANASWQDRTGQARSGLASTSSSKGTTYETVLFYSVTYGIWLEVRFGKRYAIISKVLQSQGPKIMQKYSALFSSVAR